MAMQGFAGHPDVAVRADTSTATTILLMTLERTCGAIVQAACRYLPGSSSGVKGALCVLTCSV